MPRALSSILTPVAPAKTSLVALLALFALVPGASAQRIEPDILFATFDPPPATFNFGDVSISFPAGIGEYGSNALRASIDPAGGTATGGLGISGGGAINASAASSFVFLVRSSVSAANASGGRVGEVVLEVKLKQGGVEYQAVRRLAPATGYQFVSIPISTFKSGGAGLNASAVTDVIFAVGGASGPAFTLDFDNLGFETSRAVVANDFDDGDFNNESFYTFSQSGTGINRTADGPGADGTPNAAFISYNGATAGDFAGFGFGVPGNGTIDASGTAFLEFFYRDVDDGTILLIKLQEPGGDEFITSVPLAPGAGYQRIAVPLASFTDNAAGNGVLDQLRTVAFEILQRGSGPSSLGIDGVIFRARRAPATQTAADGAGYRLLSAPVAGMAVADLASQNLVQGISDSYPGGQPNLFTAYTAGAAFGGYTPPASTAEALAPGAGFFWYLYDRRLSPGGSSESYPTPFTLFGQGAAAAATVTVSQPRNAGGGASSFHMIGNPFAVPFALSGLTETTSGGTLQTSVSAWNPARSTYQILGATDQAAVWQGFFAEVSGGAANPTFVFSAAARVSPAAPPFYGRPDAARIAFSLSGEVGGVTVSDEAAVVRFVDDAAAGWDRHDASKLTPITATHALVAFVGSGPDGAARRQSVLSLPLAGTEEVPLALTSTAEGTFTLSWSGALPGGTTASLRDASTGATYDLAAPGSVAVPVAVGTWASPLVLRVSSRAVAGEPAASAADRLGAPAPNPSMGVVRIPVQLAVAQSLRVVAYDVLGREVSAFETLQPGGASMLQADLSSLPAGLYVIRVTGEALSASRRITISR